MEETQRPNCEEPADYLAARAAEEAEHEKIKLLELKGGAK